MKILSNVSRILLGIVFIFSGFVKIIDPLGTSYKFEDYFIAFGIEGLIPASLVLSFIMCAAEFILGLVLLLNTKLKFGGWGAAVFMGIFTPVTLYIAVTNSVSDCGCFGDALVLDNWGTFYKNVVIDIFVVLLLISMKAQKAYFSKKVEWMVIGLFAISTFAFELYNYRHLPMIDFMPYKVNANIPEQMVLPKDAVTDSTVIQFIYEKDGVKKTFAQDSLPWQDTTWVYFDRIDVVIREGDEPAIHDFSITTTEHDQLPNTPANEDITDNVLKDENYSILLITSKVEKANVEALKRADELAEFCKRGNINFYSLTSSSISDVNYIKNTTGIALNFYATDETTLKTIVRANPGILLLKKGTSINKWHYTDMPSPEEFEDNYFSQSEMQ